MKIIKSYLKKHLVFFSFIIAFCSLAPSTHAQTLDSKGTNFWLAFPGNYNGGPDLTLFISADQNSTGTVSIPGLGFSTPFSVTVGSVTSVVLPAAADLGSASSTITDKGIHVTSNQEVTIYALSRITATTDAYLALPVDVLGTDYIALGYKNVDVVNGTQFAFVATANATTVTITPSVTTDGHIGGVPYNVILNQGQTYQLRNTNSSPSDLSGSIITSDKPIAVFGGHQCANIPAGALACDYVVEQLPPANAWGKNFVTVPLKTRLNGDTFRFLASTNNTQVRVNGVLVATLNRGQLYETVLTLSSQIISTQPILVAQYSNSSSYDGITSDPFMMLITPYEQFLGNYTFTTPATGFTLNFVNVVAPASAVGALRLDGAIVPAASFFAIGSTGFYGAQLNLSLGVHTLNGVTSAFGIFVYGYASYDSYGYPGGQSFAPITTVSSVSSITTPTSGTSPVGISNCFSATVRDQFNAPVAGVRVDFTITGTNPGSSGFAFTDASGVATFCYSGPNPGTDQLVASVGSLSSAPATFIWTAVVANVYYSKAAGNLHDLTTWGANPDGSGANPPDFGAGKTFNLVNRAGIYTLTNDWTVDGTIVNGTGNVLAINNFTLSEAGLTGGGTLSGSPTSNLVVTGATGGDAGTLNFTAGAGSLSLLTLNRTGTSASVAIGSTPLSIFTQLKITNGTFNTNNALTLKSTVANTARVSPIGGAISGTVVVERYIPARRAWRLLSAPVGGTQTINQSIQEGAMNTAANPAPGFGTFITGGSVGDGFDQNAGATASMKFYNSAINTWVGIPNTNSTSVAGIPYMTFVYGSRNVNSISVGLTPTNTTLRARGPLKVGDQVYPVNATGFTAIPNPYPSPINFATLTRVGVANTFYLWDPKIGGTYGVGAYVTVSYNGSTYDVSANAISPESQYIQSGQGFLVYPLVSGTAGSITIKESDKTATPAADVFRTSGANDGTPADRLVFADPTKGQGLRMNLQIVNVDGTTSSLDELFSSYKPEYSNKLDGLDAIKATNMGENLAIIRDGQTLVIERKTLPTAGDTIKLKMWNTKVNNYMLEINPVNLGTTGLSAYLQDKYLNTTTPIDIDKLSHVYFSVNSNTASARADRFSVILAKGKATDELITTGITAYPNPVEGRILNLKFVDQPAGKYVVSIMNSVGTILMQRTIEHAGGASLQTIPMDKKLVSGYYKMQITSASSRTSLPIIIR